MCPPPSLNWVKLTVINSTNEIQFFLFKNSGNIPAKKFYHFEFQVGVSGSPQGFGFIPTGITASIIYIQSSSQGDHDKSSGVTITQFAAG